MEQSGLLKAGIFFFALVLIGSLYYLTRSDAEDDPCANPQTDISGAVLAEEGDQDALINRAIIMKGNCEKKEKEK
jgi:hypothetical protein